jgi:UDP-hydrolysing UDP-N-acetyl-D-glucosamine 2-epimerase
VLRPVWKALADSGVDLHIALTGMHRATGAAKPDLGEVRAAVHELGADIGGHAHTAPPAMAAILADCGRLYHQIGPDLVLVIGDRLDMLPSAEATLPFNIPLAHLHGGEVTEGAIDDRIRHAISKLAHLHLVSCESARRHLLAMGEEDWRIVVTGAPGLDTLLAAPPMSRADFLRETGLERIAGDDERFILATVHPETNSSDPAAPMRAVLAALDELRMPVLFTAPNSDPRGEELKRMLAAWAAGRQFVVAVDTLGSCLYPNALRHAAVMVGNSSSGIIEAGLFGLPVVNVGDRQKGREAGENVRHVKSVPGAIALAMQDAIRQGTTRGAAIYGDGNSGVRIAAALIAARPCLHRELRAKRPAGIGTTIGCSCD